MRVAVTGATGNVGTALLRRLAQDERVSEIVGIARRRPDLDMPKVHWIAADVSTDDVRPHLEGADTLVHLAWLFQPTHRPLVTWQANVIGSQRTFDAARAAGVGTLIHASSVGAYSPGAGRSVTETWPTHGLPHVAYGREKAYTERLLDAIEQRQPQTRVIRIRPAFVFQREAATAQRRIFAGPLLPRRVLRPGVLPRLPFPAGLRFQAVHADDLAELYSLAIQSDARGAFNAAADGLIDGETIATLLDTQLVSVPRRSVRALMALGWHTHLVPADPALFDLVTNLPLLDTNRARTELGWQPRRTAIEAVRELLEGLHAGTGGATPPLVPDSLGGRAHELATGIGERP